MKTCQRCNNPFTCKPNDIAHCECSKIFLSEKMKEFLAEKFTDCLCVKCLIEINASNTFYQNHF